MVVSSILLLVLLLLLLQQQFDLRLPLTLCDNFQGNRLATREEDKRCGQAAVKLPLFKTRQPLCLTVHPQRLTAGESPAWLQKQADFGLFP